jgi:hypothetical protein
MDGLDHETRKMVATFLLTTVGYGGGLIAGRMSAALPMRTVLTWGMFGMFVFGWIGTVIGARLTALLWG